MKQEGNKR